MRPLIFTLIVSFASLSFSAKAAEFINVNTTLKDASLMELVRLSVANYMDYYGYDIQTRLKDGVYDAKIVAVEKNGNETTAIHIKSGAVIVILDTEHFQPVVDYYTECITRLEKSSSGIYTLELASTTCDVVPSEYDMDYQIAPEEF